MYVYTKKAEERAKALGLEERKEGTQAMFGYEPVDRFGTISKAWKERGLITEVASADQEATA